MPDTTVRITQLHIDKGVRGSLNSCPVSLALAEAGYYLVETAVIETNLRLGPDGQTLRYVHSDHLQDTIRSYDVGNKFPPSTLTVPQHAETAENRPTITLKEDS